MTKFSAEMRAKGQEVSRARREARRAAGLPATMTPIERLAERPTPGNAIKAKCYDCQGRDADPHVRQRIAACECPDCPLFAFRPYRKSAA